MARRPPRKKRASGPRNTAVNTSANASTSEHPVGIASSKRNSGKKKTPAKPDTGNNVRRRMKRVIDVLGKNGAHYKERVRTINTSVHATLRGFPPNIYETVEGSFTQESEGLGILMIRLSTFLVDITGKAQSDQDERVLLEAVCEENFYYRLMVRLADKEMYVTDDGGFNDYLEWYISEYPVGEDKRLLMRALTSVTIKYAAKKYATSFKNNIVVNYERRFRGLFFAWYRSRLDEAILKSVCGKLSRRAYELCNDEGDQQAIIQELNAYMSTLIPNITDQQRQDNHDAVTRYHHISYGSQLEEDTGESVKLPYYFARLRSVRRLTAALAGGEFRPKLFTLVPICTADRPFVTINADNTLVHISRAEKVCGTKIDRRLGSKYNLTWVNLLFDLYGKTRNHWTENCRGSQDSPEHKKKKGNYKTLKKGWDKRQGLHSLRPFFWAIKPDLTDAIIRKKGKVPIIPQLIQTDGLQVKVILMTKEEVGPDTDEEDGFVQRSFRAKGVDALSLAGYRSITRTLDIRRDKRGIYGGVKQEVDENVLRYVRVLGIDPGQKDIITVCGESYNPNPFELARNERTSPLQNLRETLPTKYSKHECNESGS